MRVSFVSIVFLLIALSAAPVGAWARSTVLVLGDSLSAAHNIPMDEGWVSLLQQRLVGEGRWQVVNASISGETSGGGAARIDHLLDTHRPAVLIVELGGNDGLRGLPIAQFRDNMTRIIERAREDDVKVLLLGIQIPTNYGPLYRRRFEAVYSQLAERFHVPLVPFLLADIALNDGLMQADGIHPTAAAQPQIVDNVWPYLQNVLSDSVANQANAGED